MDIPFFLKNTEVMHKNGEWADGDEAKKNGRKPQKKRIT
jgi:hypothetical protein